jgi:hypothetical protein
MLQEKENKRKKEKEMKDLLEIAVFFRKHKISGSGIVH